MPIRRRSAASSSATSTRAAVSAGAASKPISGVASPASSGSSKVNAEPSPSVDTTVTSPPIARASRRAIDRPRPVPAQARPWLRVHGSNSCGSSSSAIPRPVSDTVIWNLSPVTVASISATPRSVYLTALEARLSTIWRTRAASPRSASGHGGIDLHAQLDRPSAQARAQHAGDRGQQAPRVVVGGLGLDRGRPRRG